MAEKDQLKIAKKNVKRARKALDKEHKSHEKSQEVQAEKHNPTIDD